MAPSPRLEMRVSQTLVMTPQLQQAIKLLQLSNIELTAYVEQELERNPLLERDSTEDAPEPGAVASDERPAETEFNDTGGFDAEFDEKPQADAVELTCGGDLGAREDAVLDTDYTNSWDEGSPSDWVDAASGDALHWNLTHGAGGGGEDSDIEQTVSGKASLRDHLLGQLNVDVGDPVERIIGVYLIDSLDEAGYLTVHPAAVAATLDCDIGRVTATLDKVRQFDPPGVFARDLADCLALQLKDKNRLDPAMQTLLDNLDLLGRRAFTELLRLCAVDAADLADMIGEIKALNPKPGLAFDTTVAEPVTPDVLMRPRRGGGWIVELNNDTLPRLLVNTQYYAIVSKQARDKREKDYIAEQHHSANWLVKALHQRAQTILKVATEVVTLQDGFFLRGVEHLRPLTLRDVAETIEMHESTVSRVTNNKYIATPRGVFELKYFFNSAVSRGDNGDQHSSEAVRFRIKGMIDRETPDNVLSDDRICEILREDGVDIARRTVAKYREAMRIPSSVRRRRDKSLIA